MVATNEVQITATPFRRRCRGGLIHSLHVLQLLLLWNIPTAAQTVTFCALGDIPYTLEQAAVLRDQMLSVPDECPFVVHVGDLRSASEQDECTLEGFQNVAEILKLSPVPVFVLLGDNDGKDCPNSKEGLKFWEATFRDFDSTYWNHTLNVTRETDKSFHFAIEHEGTLIFGLNIAGSSGDKKKEHSRTLRKQFNWVSRMLQDYVKTQATENRIGRVVVAGHADPNSDHDDFFVPFSKFITANLNNETPILYLNGDGHKWSYNPRFYGASSFLRIMLSGEAAEPITSIHIHNTGDATRTDKAFTYDRRFTPCVFSESSRLQGISIYKYLRLSDKRCIERCSLVRLFQPSPGWFVGSCPVKLTSELKARQP